MVTEGARPAGLPAGAVAVLSETQFGAPDAAPGADSGAVVRFFSLRCENSLLAIATTDGAVYAELPCDRSLPESEVKRFLGEPLHLRIVVGSPGKLYLESATERTVEFTVGSVWIAR